MIDAKSYGTPKSTTSVFHLRFSNALANPEKKKKKKKKKKRKEKKRKKSHRRFFLQVLLNDRGITPSNQSILK